MDKGCEGCNHINDDNNCSVTWTPVSMIRCPCKVCLIKANCHRYCDKLSNYYYRQIEKMEKKNSASKG